ncbi:hypothetical protein FRB94_007466 [Tulasnella sp. JGI-2019a]|nr:hypothetical protein FRB94_007466 [Tulasnella sp. JGI-2019a]KAG9018395.1 hypothetical protein FRB93_000098 [Tulasnella sp. JGI-2019a]
MATHHFAEPLYVFSIRQSVLADLVVRPSPLAPQAISSDSPGTLDSNSISGVSSGSASMTCALCLGASFVDVSEQRAHFRSDWHRYNVKLRLRDAKLQAVTESQFSALMGGLEDSLSGSASSSEDEGSESDVVSTLLHKTRINGRSRSVSPSQDERVLPRSPILWLTSPTIPDTQLGIYTTIFPLGTTSSEYVNELRTMQDGGQHGRQWAVFMTAGGHFAGSIIRVCYPKEDTPDKGPGTTKTKSKGGQKKPELEVIRHKTFHRYTTRRKQGGSQSVNDNAKGNAKSAGAQLRRYGEQALRDDIRGLLVEWKDDINASERVFIRANISNRRTFIDFDESPIPKGDERLRTFPFPTRRPTQSELIRCVSELIRVKVSHYTEEALAAQDQALLVSLSKPKAVPTPAPAPDPKASQAPAPKLSKEEQYQRDLWSRLLEMVRKGRLDALKAFWEKQGLQLVGSVDGRLPEWLDGKDSGAGGTLLQLAAASGQDQVAHWLLEDLRADPTIAVPPSFSRFRHGDGEGAETALEDPAAPAGKQTAYDICPNSQTRNVFRRCAYAHSGWWDWLGAAGVRSVLTPEMEAKERKKEESRNKMREKAKEREAANSPKTLDEPEVATPFPTVKEISGPKSGPQKLGGQSSAPTGVAGLTPEMRARVERERRARAAEARLSGMKSG